MKKISVVIPIHNEEENLKLLHEKLDKTLSSLEEYVSEFIMVDDGSTDSSLSVIREIAQKDSRVKYISFSRNFGHESATSAGLDRAEGDCVVIIDADLQDPPELIPKLVEKWEEGYEVVYAQRRRRPGESWVKRFTSYLFYRFFNLISERKLPLDVGDFRLIDREVVLAFRRMGDYNRMVRGMITWLGFRQTGIEYDRKQRHSGKTNYNLLKLIWLSLDAITSFSIVPLRFSIAMGFIITLLSIIAGTAVLIHKLFFGLEIPGYALLTVGMFFLGGVQLSILGLIGEYIGKIYRQTLNRPLYIISEEGGFSKTNESSPV